MTDGFIPDDDGFVPDSPDIETLNALPETSMGGELGAPQLASLPQGPSEAESLARGAAQGATFGFSDEIGGGLGAGKEFLFGDTKLADLYKEYEKQRDAERAANELAAKTNPKSYMGGEIGGGILSSLVLPGGAVGEGAGLLAKSIQAAKTGATIGGLQGLGKAEGTGYNQAGEAIKGAVTGGALGAILPGAAKLGKAVPEIGGAAIGAGTGALIAPEGKKLDYAETGGLIGAGVGLGTRILPPGQVLEKGAKAIFGPQVVEDVQGARQLGKAGLSGEEGLASTTKEATKDIQNLSGALRTKEQELAGKVTQAEAESSSRIEKEALEAQKKIQDYEAKALEQSQKEVQAAENQATQVKKEAVKAVEQGGASVSKFVEGQRKKAGQLIEDAYNQAQDKDIKFNTANVLDGTRNEAGEVVEPGIIDALQEAQGRSPDPEHIQRLIGEIQQYSSDGLGADQFRALRKLTQDMAYNSPSQDPNISRIFKQAYSGLNQQGFQDMESQGADAAAKMLRSGNSAHSLVTQIEDQVGRIQRANVSGEMVTPKESVKFVENLIPSEMKAGMNQQTQKVIRDLSKLDPKAAQQVLVEARAASEMMQRAGQTEVPNVNDLVKQRMERLAETNPEIADLMNAAKLKPTKEAVQKAAQESIAQSPELSQAQAQSQDLGKLLGKQRELSSINEELPSPELLNVVGKGKDIGTLAGATKESLTNKLIKNVLGEENQLLPKAVESESKRKLMGRILGAGETIAGKSAASVTGTPFFSTKFASDVAVKASHLLGLAEAGGGKLINAMQTAPRPALNAVADLLESSGAPKAKSFAAGMRKIATTNDPQTRSATIFLLQQDPEFRALFNPEAARALANKKEEK